jgi:hypothetical protein
LYNSGYLFSCFRNTTDAVVSNTKKRQYFDITLFEELCFQNIVIRNHYFLLFLLVQGQASQEILLVREVLCMSQTSQAWHLHTTACNSIYRKKWIVLKEAEMNNLTLHFKWDIFGKFWKKNKDYKIYNLILVLHENTNSSHFGTWSFRHLVKSAPRLVNFGPKLNGTWSNRHLTIVNSAPSDSQFGTYVYIYFFICTLENYNFIDILVINI